MEKIRIDRQAQRRMKWRRISEEEVFLVLKNPDIKKTRVGFSSEWLNDRLLDLLRVEFSWYNNVEKVAGGGSECWRYTKR
jgi:hypothetical protein